jgi:hypothetical protein
MSLMPKVWTATWRFSSGSQWPSAWCSSSCSCLSSSDTVFMAKAGLQVSREWMTGFSGVYGSPIDLLSFGFRSQTPEKTARWVQDSTETLLQIVKSEILERETLDVGTWANVRHSLRFSITETCACMFKSSVLTSGACGVGSKPPGLRLLALTQPTERPMSCRGHGTRVQRKRPAKAVISAWGHRLPNFCFPSLTPDPILFPQHTLYND